VVCAGMQHCQAVSALRDQGAELACVCQPSLGDSSVVERLDVPRYTDAEEMARSEVLHGIVVAAPTHLQLQVVDQCLRGARARQEELGEPELALKALLVEDPYGDLVAALRIMQLAEEAGVEVLVGRQRQYSAFVRLASDEGTSSSQRSTASAPNCREAAPRVTRTLSAPICGWHFRSRGASVAASAPVRKQDPARAQMEHFVRVCRREERPLRCGRDALASLQIILAVSHFADTKLTVQASDLLKEALELPWAPPSSKRPRAPSSPSGRAPSTRRCKAAAASTSSARSGPWRLLARGASGLVSTPGIPDGTRRRAWNRRA